MKAQPRSTAIVVGSTWPDREVVKKISLLLIKLGVAAGVLTLLFGKLKLQPVLETMRLVPFPALIFTLLLTVLQPLLAAVRWPLILRRLGGALSPLRTFEAYWIGLFAGSLFAGVITGDGMRMWILSRAGLRPSKSVNSVLLDRAAALAGLLLLVATTLPFLDNRVADNPVRYGASLLLLAGVAVCCSIGLMTRVPARWQKYRLARALMHVTNDLWSIWRRPSIAAALLLLSVLATLCNALGIFVLMRSLDVSINLIDTMVLSPLVILVITLPLSVGGWGLREASMVGLFGMVGVPATVSLSVSILLGLLALLVSLPGALVMAMMALSAGRSRNGLPTS
jgi:glycosyltransferase 2 family protein